MSREKEDKVNLDLACEAVLDRASEHNLVVLLDKWSMCWKQRGRTRAIGPHAYEKYSTLGFYGHGGVFGISKASEMKRACMAVNHFLRERFPSKTWTSIAVLYNPSMPLHGDILNMIGHANHAVALGNFLEGRVWIEDENGQSTTVLETKNGQKLGTWIDMHDAPVTFNARKYHMLEKHRGNMWALAAYTLQAFKHAAASHINKLSNLAFQFLSYSKQHQNDPSTARNLSHFVKLNSKRSETHLERNHVIRDQNDPNIGSKLGIGSKLKPFIN